MFLSGVHNVLYESQCISFFAVGWYTVAHQKSRTASAIRHYTEGRGNTPLRPHLVTIRIYLMIALFIICILDFLCIRQCLMHFDYAVLTLGTVSTLCTLIGVISLISCIVLFRHCSKNWSGHSVISPAVTITSISGSTCSPGYFRSGTQIVAIPALDALRIPFSES